MTDRTQRIALARIVSDLIEADFIIEKDEMTFFEELNERLHITKDMLVEAKTKTVEWALNTLKGLDDAQKQEVKDILQDLALSDGTCVPLEALQIISAFSVLDGKGEVISIPASSSHVDNMNVIYIENEDGTDADRHIFENYRAICNELQLAGFNFVYIPMVVEDYRQMGEDYLCKSISYMIPSLSAEKISRLQKELCSVTTSKFCRQLLARKTGLHILDSKPALLFKTGDSYVVGEFQQDEEEKTTYCNYLKIDVEEDVLKQVTDFTNGYRSILSSSSYVEVRPAAKKFLCYGFHRSLFDLLAFGKEQTDYRLVIDLEDRRNACITFKPIGGGEEDEELKLTPLASALYILMVRESIFGQGLDWREYPGKAEKERILSTFNTIYRSIGNRDEQTDYKDRVLVSRIKKELRKQQSCIANISSFIPEIKSIEGASFYTVPVLPDKVSVVENGQEVRMDVSAFWAGM